MAKKVKWEEMRPDEFVAAREGASVAYVAVGPLEWHSLHLPLGVDPMKAYYYLCRVAERVGGVVYPPIYMAMVSANRDDLPLKSEAYGQEFFEREMEARLEFIASNGFKTIVVISGHGGALWLIQQIGARVGARHGVKVFATQDEMHCSQDLYRGDHAGGEETSMMLNMRPDLVDLSKLPPLPEPLNNNKLIIHSPRPDPRTQSSVEYGRESIEMIVADLERCVRELLAGREPKLLGQ